MHSFVNATADFEDLPKVVNGPCDLIVEPFGPDVGNHARTSIGWATSPSRVAGKIDVIIIDEEGVEHRASQFSQRIEPT